MFGKGCVGRALLLALVAWGDRFVDSSVAVLGDNTGALQDAIALKGRGPLLYVARELSWRTVQRGWSYVVGHLPSEFNSIADSLSRVADPKNQAWPSDALASALPTTPPRLKDLWLAVPV